MESEEAKLYDRQIRLWGHDAQTKIKQSKILIWDISGCGAEIAKNLVLAGIGSLGIIQEPRLVNELDCEKNFLFRPNSLGKDVSEQAQIALNILNPSVKIQTFETFEKEILDNFNVLVVCDQSVNLIDLNEFTIEKKVMFCVCQSFGYFGLILTDFSQHRENQLEIKRLQPIELNKQIFDSLSERKRKEFLPPNLLVALSALEAQSRSSLIEFVVQEKLASLNLEQTFVSQDVLKEIKEKEFVPFIGAIIGGFAAQEIIKAVSGTERLVDNIFFYDGLTGLGSVHSFNKK